MTFWLRRAKVLGLQSVLKISNLCGPDPPTLQTDRRPDGRTPCDLNTALNRAMHYNARALHYNASRGKKYRANPTPV